jgi:hypothetical protein
MKRLLFTPPAPDRGRPRSVTLSEPQQRELARIYLKTNRTFDQGSMEMAWVLFTESEAGREHAWTVENRRIATRLPVAALEVMRRARPLVGAARGGAKRLRSEGPYVAGSMRMHWSENRRLYAGEQFSVDDLTRNVPCWIPWPWGGCKCSDKFGVRLGRWQTLAVHDDATGTLVSVKSVFRYEQSYRGADAASIVFQTESEVGMAGFGLGESVWVVEGGVWQSEQMLATLAGRYTSAKGRPNQKLIERWFGAMQTRDSVNFGEVGRIRGEKMEENALYLACRRGEKDPRKLFLCMEEGQDSMMETFEWMNTREIRSKTYGNWVPMERWEHDISQKPLVTRNQADVWVMSPERRRLKITRNAMISCQAVGPLGVSMPLVFSAPWLWEHAGRQVDLYFDPLGEWPITATVACPKTRKMLGTVTCQNTFGQNRDADAAMATAIRKTMMSELRCIVGSRKAVTEVRGISGTTRIERASDGHRPPLQISHRSEADHLTDREKNQRFETPAVLDPQTSNRGGGSLLPDAGRLATPTHDRASGGERGVLPAPGDRSLALSRRAAKAREQAPNW